MALSTVELAAPLCLEQCAGRGPGAPLKATNPPCSKLLLHQGIKTTDFPFDFFKSSCHTKEKPALNVCHLCPCSLGSSYHKRNCISLFRL